MRAFVSIMVSVGDISSVFLSYARLTGEHSWNTTRVTMLLGSVVFDREPVNGKTAQHKGIVILSVINDAMRLAPIML